MSKFICDCGATFSDSAGLLACAGNNHGALQPDLVVALDCLAVYVRDQQVHTRKGAYTGQQEPLADAVQSPHWRRAKALLVKYNYPVPVSGMKMDG